MRAVTIRNLSEEAHRALKVRAAKHGRSTEAEMREILEEAARPAKRTKIGAELAALGRRLKIDFEPSRDQTPIAPASLE